MIMVFYDSIKTKLQDESMNGLLSLFYVNGIDVKRRKLRRQRMTFLAILFHSVWLFATTANIWCLSDSMYSSLHIFTVLAKTVALAIWWTIRREAKNLHELLKSLLCLLKHTGSKMSASTQMLSRVLPWLMLVVSFLPAALWMASSTEIKDSCFVFWAVVDSKVLFGIVYFFLSALQQYVNWCMPYAAGVFFVCFCKEVSRVASKLTVASGGEDVRKLYRVLVTIVCRLDRALSLAMLFSLARCLMEFFRALFLYFQYSKDVHEIKFVFCGVFYTLESALLYVSIVLFADKVQADCNVLRKCLLRDGSDGSSGIRTWKAVEKCSQLFEDKEDIKLSVWQMLRLKKKVLFTTVTSLVTYGVILHQFHN